MIVSDVETQSPIVKKILDHIDSRISLTRTKNDKHLDIVETASLRGEIRALKDLAKELKLPEPHPAGRSTNKSTANY